MESRSFKLPKGEYYFGDLSYLFPHPNYPTEQNKEWIDIFSANDEGDWDYMDVPSLNVGMKKEISRNTNG